MVVAVVAVVLVATLSGGRPAAAARAAHRTTSIGYAFSAYSQSRALACLAPAAERRHVAHGAAH